MNVLPRRWGHPMSKRPVARKITIVFENRDPNDSGKFLQAVEDAFRPKDLEIVVTSVGRPDEQLETEAREQASAILDKKDREHRSAPIAASKQAVEGKRRQILRWLQGLAARGWRVL